MTVPNAPRESWDDRRLEAAFTARAATTRTPTELVREVVERVRTADPPMPVWRRWLPAAAVVVLAVGVIAGGIALSDDLRGRGLVRPGPTADLKTLDTGEYAFDFPASWLTYEASAGFSGGSSTAVLGTLPVERQCGNERHVDVNCVNRQRLEPGHVRLYVGTGTYRSGTLQDLPKIDGVTRVTRVEIGGMPAILAEGNGSPDSYYREDKSLHWEIARPGTNGTSVVELEALLTDPGVAEARRQLDALVASFRFTNGPDPSTTPTPKPTPAETAPRLADLRVMTVQELIAAAESPTPEEVVVEGWLARTSAIMDCAHVIGHPLIPVCNEHGLYLLDDPVTGIGATAPSEPHLVPMLRVDAHSDVDIPYGQAVEVRVVGHQLDHRWTTCPPEAQEECKRRFVIDRVVGAGQPLLDPQPWASPPDLPVGASYEPIEVLASLVGSVTVVSIGVADANAVRSIEPLVQEINNEEGARVIRALVAGDRTPVARTFLVGHIGYWTVVEVTETDVVDRIARPQSSWPPEGALGVTMPESNTGLTPRAGVVDRTGLLVDAQGAGADDPNWGIDLEPGETAIVQAAPDTIIAYWNGAMCDDRYVLTVYGDRPSEPPDRMELRGERADGCRPALVHYGIRLRFSEPVDAATIEGWDRVGTPHEAFPPVDSMVVPLAKDGGFELPQIEVALVDLSGRVTHVRAPREGEPSPLAGWEDGPVVLRSDPQIQGRYHLYWKGGICDDRMVVTIDGAFAKVSVNGVPRQACDAMGVVRQLVIDVDGALDPSAVETTYTVTVIGAS